MKLPKAGDKVKVISLKGLKFDDYEGFIGKIAIVKKFEKNDNYIKGSFCEAKCKSCTCEGSIQLEGTHTSIYYCDERFRLIEDNNNEEKIPAPRVKSRLEDLIL